LPQGNYEILFLKPGFEPLELFNIEVVAEERTHLGLRQMHSGNADLTVQVIRPFMLEKEVLQIELHSLGRGPYEVCQLQLGELASPPSEVEVASDRCPVCGYARDYSTVSLNPKTHQFQFANLAKGDYQIILRNKRGSILCTEQIRLDSGEQGWAELAPQLGRLVLEITGPEDEPFDVIGHEEGRQFYDQINLYLWEAELLSGAAKAEALGKCWLKEPSPEQAEKTPAPREYATLHDPTLQQPGPYQPTNHAHPIRRTSPLPLARLILPKAQPKKQPPWPSPAPPPAATSSKASPSAPKNSNQPAAPS
jgi:hypothetical protein